MRVGFGKSSKKQIVAGQNVLGTVSCRLLECTDVEG